MKRNNLKSQIYIIPMIIMLLSILFMNKGNYENTIDIIMNEYGTKLDLIERSLYNEVKYTNIIKEISEGELEREMKHHFLELIETYRENPNISQWDFRQLKEDLGGMDIYAIDRGLTIVASSIEEEIGMDFNKFPKFANVLRKRLDGDGFYTDMINFSFQGKELKKFGYTPSPDTKYLFELSANIGEMYPQLLGINVVNLTKILMGSYPFIEGITIYRFNDDSYETSSIDFETGTLDNEIILEEKKIELIKKALNQRKVQAEVIEENRKSYTIKYIPYVLGYDRAIEDLFPPYVMEVVYSNEDIYRDVSEQRYIYFRNMFATMLIYIIFASTIVYLMRFHQRRSYLDHLTNLPNRKKFEEDTNYMISEGDKKGKKFAVLFFDLDGFKLINDEYGHRVGDILLQEVARRIKVYIPREGDIYRLGGDEFIGILPFFKSHKELVDLINKLPEIFTQPFIIEGIPIFIKSSIGVSIYPEHGQTVEELIHRADMAMYEAKSNKTIKEIYGE